MLEVLALGMAVWVAPEGARSVSSPIALDGLQTEVIAEGLDVPVAVTVQGDRLYISTLPGRVWIVDSSGQVLPDPFLDISADLLFGGVQGLYSLAFSPDYETNGFVFVHFTAPDSSMAIERFEVSANPDRVDPSSGVILLSIPKEAARHNGGQLQFGPAGLLYVATGDGSTGEIDPDCDAQSLSSLEGKILRLDVGRSVGSPPYYAVPEDNPFLGRPSALPEIWAYGLRNPWRFSFDRETGDLWTGDVGELDREEINLQLATSTGGENYGWKAMEGTACLGDTTGCQSLPSCSAPELVPPALEYAHVGGRCSVTGGSVYRGRLIPELYGSYLYGDFCTGEIWAAKPAASGGFEIHTLPFRLPGLASFGEDGDGEILLVDGGAVYRLVDPALPLSGLLEFATPTVEIAEGEGATLVEIRRVGGAAGAASVRVSIQTSTATLGVDYTAEGQRFDWGAGDDSARQLALNVIQDAVPEADETVVLSLSEPQGAELGARTISTVTIVDDDPLTCLADGDSLCLNQSRFRVEALWRTTQGAEGRGQGFSEGDDVGSFWFFSDNNLEVFVKVLNACFPPFDKYWVFAAGLTNVEVDLTVVDTRTGESRSYHNPLGRKFETITDTAAFDCP